MVGNPTLIKKRRKGNLTIDGDAAYGRKEEAITKMSPRKKAQRKRVLKREAC